MTYSGSIDVIELSSSNDDTSSRSSYSIHFEYSTSTSDTNPTRARYCKRWVATMCNKRRSTRLQNNLQNNRNIYDSEDEVEDLIQTGIQAEPTEGSDVGTERGVPQSKSETILDSSSSSRRSSVYAPVSEYNHSASDTLVDQTESPAPLASGSLTPQTTYSFHMEPAERRTPMPGDEWDGPKSGYIEYVLPPMDLLFLCNEGGRWSFTRTAPTSNCHNRLVGDIHLAPNEVRGYDYWVCCEMEGTKFGKGWAPWDLHDAHPLYPDLVLRHFYYEGSPPVWALKLSGY
ncbi:hypothetical protein FRC12_011147 [Ceratobasidium sp. 428]|nr:hypothetical protein FRC12_011147 [Ceratobasidium sp. 428]